MLATKSHTFRTVHALISSLWAWQRRCWAVADVIDALDGVWARLRAGGEVRFRPGLGDSSLIRFDVGVGALKSSGDPERTRSFDCAFVVGTFDVFVVAVTDSDWLMSDDAFCWSDMYCSAAGTFGNERRFCGDALGFDDGDCCGRITCCCWLLFDDWPRPDRFEDVLRIFCISASLATRACEERID